MNPFVAKPGETIIGLGLDFSTRLATGETISATPTVTADTGITVSGQSFQGTMALANITIPPGQTDADLNVYFSVTGTAGSVRKGSRGVWIRAKSE